MFSTHILTEEVEYWWDNTRQRLEATGTYITWDLFKTNFLEQYSLVDACSKKEIKFLELKQGNMIVMDYAAKFKELSRFFPH